MEGNTRPLTLRFVRAGNAPPTPAPQLHGLRLIWTSLTVANLGVRGEENRVKQIPTVLLMVTIRGKGILPFFPQINNYKEHILREIS